MIAGGVFTDFGMNFLLSFTALLVLLAVLVMTEFVSLKRTDIQAALELSSQVSRNNLRCGEILTM